MMRMTLVAGLGLPVVSRFVNAARYLVVEVVEQSRVSAGLGRAGYRNRPSRTLSCLTWRKNRCSTDHAIWFGSWPRDGVGRPVQS